MSEPKFDPIAQALRGGKGNSYEEPETEEPDKDPSGYPLTHSYEDQLRSIGEGRETSLANCAAEEIKRLKARVEEAEAELAAVRSAISEYHYALDTRQHGGIAQDRAFNLIRSFLGMDWKQGEELKKRAVK